MNYKLFNLLEGDLILSFLLRPVIETVEIEILISIACEQISPQKYRKRHMVKVALQTWKPRSGQ